MMTPFSKFALSALFSAGLFSAEVVDYSTSFSSSDSPAFVEGKLDAQNSWVAHPVYSVADAAGAGVLNRINANGPVHLDSSMDLTSELAAGKTITLTLEFDFVGAYMNQNNGAWLLGICNNADGMPEGANSTIGGVVFQNNGSSNLWLSPIAFPNGDKFDTTLPWDSDYHTLTTTITRSATENEFDITVNLDGQSTSYTMTHAGLWDGTDIAYAGFRFRGNQDGNVDSFSVSSSGDGGGGGDGSIAVENTSYEPGAGFTINYSSTVGPVDVYRNDAGDLSPGNFSLIATEESGGTFVDSDEEAELEAKAFYVLVAKGDAPFDR
jgi:hypothetical protein